jgi:putative MATE family efflux protein
MTAVPEPQLAEDLTTASPSPSDQAPGETTPHGAASAVPGQPRRLRFRRPGLSLASFPAALYAFLPFTLQARLVPGSVMHQVLSLAWPSVLEQSLVTLIGLVDAYIVGHLGAVALAGVGMGGQVLNLTAAVYGAVGVGGTALVARHIGAREPDEANRLARQAVLLALALGALTALACFSLAHPIMQFFGAEADVVSAGALWLRVVSPSLLFLGVLLVGTAALRGGGDTRTPLMVMLAVNVVNVAVAWTFTRGLFGLPNLGIAGSALGAMSGHSVGGLVVLWLLVRGRGHLKLGWQVPRPDLARLRRILNIGLPAGAEQVLLQVAQVNLAVVIAQFGTAAYAAHQVGLRIAALSFLPGWGFSVAATTLVGQELGARNPERARRATYASFALALAVMTSMAVVLFVFADPILRLFTDDAAVIAAGHIVIRTSAVIQPMMAASFVFSGALRGAGDTRATMVITVATIWGLRLLMAYVLGVMLGLGLFGAWLAVGIDFAVRSLLFWLRFRTGRWARLRV